ncbi:MAG: hypothetical protein R3F65_29470 [bacterium]|nr:hypothetical protein [Myxococcales bacterium]MCB9543722.1 hypothetical protein [Myxococcales bacterium]MCB9552721.1 hypothetical protein [Myxococcales bacterium]
MPDTIREHLTTEDTRLATRLQKALAAGDRAPYDAWLARPENHALRGALHILEHGLAWRLHWDGAAYTLVPRKQKPSIGPALHAFLRRTDTLVMFTDGFSAHRSKTAGGHINGAWEPGEIEAIGAGREKYKVRKRSVIWLSTDLRRSPVALALLIAHELGHGIASEQRDNHPLPLDPALLKKPPYTTFPTDERDDDDRLCYPLEGLLARELGQNPDLSVQRHTPMTADARRWYTHVFGSYTTAAFRDKLRLGTVFAREEAYSARGHVCGMRCKYFDQYGYCNRRVKVPPCWQFEKHLEGWLTPDTVAPGELPEDFVPDAPR